MSLGQIIVPQVIRVNIYKNIILKIFNEYNNNLK
jgi:hypothetical protein